MEPNLTLAPGLCHNRDALLNREWLVTNGIGGYAMGTVAGVNTRAYHGYLVAATQPPVGRTVLLQRVDEQVRVDGEAQGNHADYARGNDGPGQYHSLDGCLEAFVLDGTLPVWTFVVGQTRLQKRVWMAYDQNTTYLQYTLLDAAGPLELQVTLGVADRDHHGSSTADGKTWSVSDTGPTLRVKQQGATGATPWHLSATPAGDWRAAGQWSQPFFLTVEAERGLQSDDQCFQLGSYRVRLAAGECWTLIASTEAPGAIEADVVVALQQEQDRQDALVRQAGLVTGPAAVKQLVLAADQFIVQRAVQDDGSLLPGVSVIAGYPWFGDWGRDTMISLPGLCLATRRYDVAANVLRTFARFVSQGMLPNRFPDAGEAPEYNTVDATLWYFHAIASYVDVTGDSRLLAELYPVLADIVDWHIRGTRYGIGVDPADGLLRAGMAGAQLSWMDVRIDAALLEQLAPTDPHSDRASATHGFVVTPRHGKAVEINALWYNALRLMAIWSTLYSSDDLPVHDYGERAEQVRVNFGRFWFPAGQYLYDVLDTPGGDDATLRPNQVFALSLAPQLLPEAQRRAALAAVTRHLWTPVGLRTLAPGHVDYQRRFTGNRVQRDLAYHQGTVWPWLLGHYLDALQQIEPQHDIAVYLQPLLDHLWDVGLGTISEVFDAEPPRFGAGCPAQAWSVAEVLRSAIAAL